MTVRNNQSVRKRKRSSHGISSAAIIAVSILFAAFILSRNRQATIVQASQVPAPIIAEYDTVRLPVPEQYVPAGTQVKDIKFKQVTFPRHQVPEDALISLDRLTDGATIVALPANLPVFESNFSTKSLGTNPVVERIPAGMRAMTISVDATSVVEGWAGTGAVVDVLLVEKDRTTVIAEKVRILSAERSVSPMDEDSTPSVPRTVTLLVSQEQCLAINTAVQQGKIALALRGMSDESDWSGDTFSSEQLRGGAKQALNKGPDVSGVVIVKDAGSERSYALSGRKWVPTDVVPEGFLIGR